MGWLSTALLAITCASTPGTTELLDELRAENPELFTVPIVSGWPDGLPDPVDTPKQGLCRDLEGRELGLGTWLPDQLGRMVQWRLLYLDNYAPRAQAVVDALVPRVVDAVAAKVAADVTKENYELSTVITWALVGVALGAAATTTVILSTR